MNKPKLTYPDLVKAASILRVDVATVKTVMAVESGGTGFTPDGRCVIRFEPHLFSRKTKGIYDQSHPELSFPVRKQGYPTSVNQSWTLFQTAAALDPTAAVLSTSWGLFQILGSNFASCDCANLGEFVKRMEDSEGQQLELFCHLILDWGLDDELRGRQWAAFARIYNGPGYRSNDYDGKMERAFARFRIA